VTVTQPILYPVQTYREYNGNLEAIETVRIEARVKGFLKEVAFKEGTEVETGDLLFRIDPREYEASVQKAEADRLRAAAEVRKARTEAERGRSLAIGRALSSEELDQRLASLATAEAMLLQAEAVLEGQKLERSFTEIKAPISGLISRALVTPGNLVGQGETTLLTTIVSVDPIYVYFDVPERDLVEYQRARKSEEVPSLTSRELPIEVGVTTEKGYPHLGKIDFRENRVDAGTGTVRMRGRVPNPMLPPGKARLLYSGLYARVRVPSGKPRMLPVVPEDAVLTGQEGRYVYVLDEKNVVQKRTVTVAEQVFKGAAPGKGEPAGWRLVEKDKATPVTSVVALESGIGPEDRVIVNGLTRARPGAPVAPEQKTLAAPADEMPRK